MKRWPKVVAALAGLLVLFVAVIFIGGLAIDPKIEVGVEKRLARTPEQLFPLLSSASGIAKWWSSAPPMEGQPKMEVKKKSGPDEGAGLMVTFEAGGTLMETWEVKASHPSSRVVYEVDFAGMMKVERTLTLTPDSEGTKVSWKETGTLDSAPMRWMKVIMPADAVAKNFEAALELLEKAAD